MLKIMIIVSFSCVLVLLAMRFSSRWRFQIQRLMQNPFVNAILLKGLWRLVRLLIFRRVGLLAKLAEGAFASSRFKSLLIIHLLNN